MLRINNDFSCSWNKSTIDIFHILFFTSFRCVHAKKKWERGYCAINTNHRNANRHEDKRKKKKKFDDFISVHISLSANEREKAKERWIVLFIFFGKFYFKCDCLFAPNRQNTVQEHATHNFIQ